MAYSGCEDSFAFQAGSYMYYSKWRNQLAEMAGLGSAEAVRTNPEKEGLPFVELINFSDCEGVIGPKVAAKLAKDFADYEDRASPSRRNPRMISSSPSTARGGGRSSGPPTAAWFILASPSQPTATGPPHEAAIRIGGLLAGVARYPVR